LERVTPADTTVDRDAIAATELTIRPYIRTTPVLECPAGDVLPGLEARLVFKLELLQHAGSFKARGAFANLLLRHVPDAGVVAASGGNHGAAVAYAARALGVPAKIFVPTISSPGKIQRIRDYGANLVVGGERYADALAASQAWASQSGAMTVHAFDQQETILGQGTLGLELEQQSPALDTLLVAVGGGGLIAGIAAWFCGSVKVVAVEPERSPTLFRAMEAGRPVDAETEGIAADSLAPRRVGDQVFPIAQRHVSQVVLVPDAAIIDAQRTLWSLARIAAEPGGAASFAALLARRYTPEKGERVGVLISGGNTDAVSFGA
jgi:threonine dehydratase